MLYDQGWGFVFFHAFKPARVLLSAPRPQEQFPTGRMDSLFHCRREGILPHPVRFLL